MVNNDYLFDIAALRAWQERQLGGTSRRKERLQKCLTYIIEDLTDHQREVFDLHYRQGLNVTQIARVLGCHKSSASRTLTRIKRKIRLAMRYIE